MEEIAGPPGRLTMRGEFAAGPDVLYEWWTQPDRLTAFWAGEAETDPRAGGGYRLHWPQMVDQDSNSKTTLRQPFSAAPQSCLLSTSAQVFFVDLKSLISQFQRQLRPHCV